MVAKYPNWFAEIAQANFEQLLLPEAGEPDLKYLQLGVFTGDASVWLLENVLTGKNTYLHDIDSWAGAHNEPVQTAMDFDDVYNTYKDKVKRFNNSYHAKAMTQDYLVTVHHRKHIYDFIYVDAHHTSASALLDCELSWPLLKPEGILAIDEIGRAHV